MELFTMNTSYAKLSEIDYFSSAIWTERSLGDGDFQLDVPATPETISDLWFGTRVGLVGSKEVMMVDKMTIKNETLSVIGTSLTQQLNNRFIRFTGTHNDQSYSIVNTPGYILQYLVQNFAIGGDWLDGAQDMGFPNPQILKIPDFTIGTWDNSLVNDPGGTPNYVVVAVPYGPLYDALRTIADTYNHCIKVERWGVGDIRFRDWIGVDHTSQGGNALVRFSADMDNFGDTSEIVDGTKFKTHAYVFASQLPETDFPGYDTVEGAYSGFDLRAEMVLASDITANTPNINDSLMQRAYQTLATSRITAAVDGTIRPGSEYVFGEHYYLGDIVETQGSNGLTSSSRITEFIRAQDANGEKAYPTLVSIAGADPNPAPL